MLIAEELFLLLRRDDGKEENAFAYNGYGLAAAVISDLILAGSVSVTDEKRPRLHVLSNAPTGNSVLDAALARLAERDGKKLADLVTDGKLDPEERVAGSLRDAGVVGVEEKRMLGLVPVRYPMLDPAPEHAVRHRLRATLAGATPGPADSVLLAILQGLDIAWKVLEEERGDLGRKQLKQRIEEVSQEAVAGLAVGKAVEAMNMVMLTAVIIPATTTTTS